MKRAPAQKLFSYSGIAKIAVLLWLTLVSLMPTSVMPVVAQDGTMVLTLCSGDGPIDVVVDLATGKTQRPSESQNTHCDWACAQLVGLSFGTQKSLPLPDAIARQLSFPNETQGIRLAFEHLDVWARGPPKLA